MARALTFYNDRRHETQQCQVGEELNSGLGSHDWLGKDPTFRL